MISVPEKLINCSFVLLGGDDGKKPIEKNWPKLVHRIDDIKLQEHLAAGKNYGIMCGQVSPIIIDGNAQSLIVVDFDNENIQNELLPKLPKTFTVKTGGKGLLHLYFASNDSKSFKVLDSKFKTLLDVQGDGKQVVAAGSINPKTNRAYEIVEDIPIAFISYIELKALLLPYDKSPKKPEKPIKQYIPKGNSNDIVQRMIDSVSMKEVLEEIGVDTSKNPTNCFGHDSEGCKCLGWNDKTAHCFHCEKSWNKFSLIRDGKNITNKDTFNWFATKSGMEEELRKERIFYIQQNKKENSEISSVINKISLVKCFLKEQPIFYDRAMNWWIWSSERKCWELKDEIDILNMFSSKTDTITNKERIEFLNAMKQVGRRMLPMEFKKTWIQFGSKIYDIVLNESFDATPEYFATNPLPYELSTSEETPTIDKIFAEWVGEGYTKTLYEIIAYCMLSDYPLHRIFCLIGEGLNGKSCFLSVLKKFVGLKNCSSVDLDVLLNNHFHITKMYKKLVCIMGETNFAELNHTSILKRLTGGDLIGFEHKNKTPFDDYNYAKIIIATNNLPATTDKTIGFYRRWMIVDFINKFNETKNILDDIPEQEYCNLTRKCVNLLQELLQRREFTNEGTVEIRTKRYEEKSNPLQKFFDENIIEDCGSFIFKYEFKQVLNDWCKANRFREMTDVAIAKFMKTKQIFDIRERALRDSKEEKYYWSWTGIKWKK